MNIGCSTDCYLTPRKQCFISVVIYGFIFNMLFLRYAYCVIDQVTKAYFIVLDLQYADRHCDPF